MTINDLIQIHEYYVDNVSGLTSFICTRQGFINLEKDVEYPLLHLEHPISISVSSDYGNNTMVYNYSVAIHRQMSGDTDNILINEVIKENTEEAEKLISYLKDFNYHNDKRNINNNIIDLRLNTNPTIVSETYKRGDVNCMTMIDLNVLIVYRKTQCDIDWIT